MNSYNFVIDPDKFFNSGLLSSSFRVFRLKLFIPLDQKSVKTGKRISLKLTFLSCDGGRGQRGRKPQGPFYLAPQFGFFLKPRALLWWVAEVSHWGDFLRYPQRRGGRVKKQRPGVTIITICHIGDSLQWIVSARLATSIR